MNDSAVDGVNCDFRAREGQLDVSDTQQPVRLIYRAAFQHFKEDEGHGE
jgi:hypothetical protein